MRRFAFASALLAAFVMWSGSAPDLRAQTTQPTRDIQTVPLPIFGLGGGISIPAGGVAKDRVPGFNVSGLAEFHMPNEPLGIRGEVLYQYFGAKQEVLGATSSNSVAFLVNVVYHAVHSSVRPYVLGGMGLYHISGQGNNAGLSAGTGVSIPLVGMGAYAEVRVHAALSQGPGYVTVPVAFGITF